MGQAYWKVEEWATKMRRSKKAQKQNLIRFVYFPISVSITCFRDRLVTCFDSVQSLFTCEPSNLMNCLHLD